MENNSNYYNNSPQMRSPQPPQGSLPPGSPLQQSPQIETRRQKRHYPRPPQAGIISGYQQQLPPSGQSQFQQPQASPSFQPQAFQQHQPLQSYQQAQPFLQQRQPSPFQPSPQFQAQQPISRYASPVPTQASYNGEYNQTLSNLSAMNLQQHSPRQDVSLVGQPPVIQDIHRELPPANVPTTVTATSSANAQVDRCFKRATVNAFPYSNTLLKKSKLSLALILEPYISNKVEKVEVPVVPDTIVTRCSRCKTYINPFVQFTAGALQWKCNMCEMENEVPQAFDWDILTGQQTDRYSRVELNFGCVDFIAPAEYAVRPPQPPVYVFVIDTSFQSVQTGMIGIVADAIKNSLDKIPNEDGRTKVAFISADNAVGFHKLSSEEPEILVVGDLADMYLPRASSDLIVNLMECRATIDNFLERMKTMYQNTHTPSNCLGSALQAARKLLSPTGGKIVCFQASLPNVGDGVIKPKTDANKSALDSPLMTASSNFYKTFAGECTKSQVCADMFIFGNQFADVATLNVVPRFTGGQTHFYPGFSSSNQGDAIRLKEEIISLLSEQVGLEAVMRTRCSPGIVCRAFYGNCTTRVPDIMALPNVPRDQSYCIDLGIEEDIQGSFVHFQTALLYTTCFGERRIRVMNLCLPVTKSISELYSSVDQVALARAICHQATDKGANGKLRDGREYLSKQVVDVCSGYAKEVIGVSSANSQLTVCRELNVLPLLILGVLKTEAFNDASAIPADIRAQSALLLRTLPTDAWLQLVHPNFYSIYNMPQLAGTIDNTTGKCVMPPALNLSSEKLESHGCYLIENSQQILLWIGKGAVPQLCKDLLGVTSIQEVKSGQVAMLPKVKSLISERVNNIVEHLQKDRHTTYYPSLFIVKEDGDPMLRSRFLNYLIEDRQPTGPTSAGANQQHASSGMSYFQWLGYIRSKSQ